MPFTSLLPPDRLTVAIDGGTTNTRVRLLRGASVIAEHAAAIGARDVAQGQRDALARAVAEGLKHVIDATGTPRVERIVACGMLTSEVGLEPVAHVSAPAGIDELARAALWRVIPEISDIPILLIPGIRTPPTDGPDGWIDADVMRGEECETLGWRHFDAPPDDERWCCLWPGSHTKLVALGGDGRIQASYTTLAGELIAATSRHTVLAASLPAALPEQLDPDAVDVGARIVEGVGLDRAAFLVRIAALGRDWSAEQRAAFWIGAIVGDDVTRLLAHRFLNASPRARVMVGGESPLGALYGSLLERRYDGAVRRFEATRYYSALGAALIGERRTALDT